MKRIVRNGLGSVLGLAACAVPSGPPPVGSAPSELRIATFNVEELSTAKLDDVDEAGVGAHPQARAAAEIVRRVRPDVLVVQEIDHDYRSADDLAANARRFVERYLAAGGEGGSEPIDYPHLFAAPCNTGIASGHDLDGDGEIVGPEREGDRRYGQDSFGFGHYPGQYAMAVLSRFPIDAAAARTFQRFRWRDLPGGHLPEGFYSEEEVEILRLSSKSHWDLPLAIDGRTLRLWVSHPTPPVFDGPEDRNGRRNHDETAFWLAYLDGETALTDDAGLPGGRVAGEPFVIAGDLNADPWKGEAFSGDGTRAIVRLLGDGRLIDTGEVATSRGALLHEAGGGARKPGPPGYPERATAVFLGGMRIDYLLPSSELTVTGGGVFWPAPADDAEGARLAAEASDHRLVWIDLALPAGSETIVP